MLQQTRIEAVLPYYERFMRRLPDVTSLADVSEDELLKLWEGLGYYSRARNLKKAAEIICKHYGGELPCDYRALLALPGIGEYTAGAIASIAFSIPVPAVDGNVMRVLARLTGDDTDVLSTLGKKRFTALAARMVPQEQPGRFNQALMELGETICLPNQTPRCAHCPLRDVCVAHAGGLTDVLPVRNKKTKRRMEERMVYVVVTDEQPRRVLLHKREDKGLLAGLWELPNKLSDEPIPPIIPLTEGDGSVGTLPKSKHIFSHITWLMEGTLVYTSPFPLPANYVFADANELAQVYALPSAFSAYAARLPAILSKEDV